MYSVGIRELKNKLSQYLRYARQGERLIVTERGKPIAIIQPVDTLEHPSFPEQALARLAQEGMVRLPQKRFTPKLPLLEISEPSVSSAVIEDRR